MNRKLATFLIVLNAVFWIWAISFGTHLAMLLGMQERDPNYQGVAMFFTTLVVCVVGWLNVWSYLEGKAKP